MTTSLLSSLIRMGILILAPWLVFSNYDKKEAVDRTEEKRQDKEHFLESKERKNDIPVHFIPLHSEDFENQTETRLKQQLTEYCSIVTEVLTVCWLTFKISVRSFCTRLCLSLKPKSAMEIETTAAAPTEFTSAETDVLNAHASSSAVNAVLHHALPASTLVKAAIPDAYLLQFASLIDDVAAQKCIKDLGPSYRLSAKHGLLGGAERDGWSDQPWEKRLFKQKKGVVFSMERKYLRDGLYVYRSTAVFKNAEIEEFRRFILNPADRMNWDWSCLDMEILRTDAEKAEVPFDCESAFLFTENKMPRPWCNREYVTARRVWNRPDGGCYSITKSASHPLASSRKGRNVRVEEYASAFVLRPIDCVNGTTSHAVEMTSLYFDNVKIRPMAYNLAMNTSMWTGISVTDTGFRKQQSTFCPIQDGEHLQGNGNVVSESTRQEPARPRRGGGGTTAVILGAAATCVWVFVFKKPLLLSAGKPTLESPTRRVKRPL